jgi:hypothetical protein
MLWCGARKGPRDGERGAGVAPGDAADAGHLDRLGPVQRREDARQPPREHRLPGARWTLHQEVVTARRGDHERLDRLGVAADGSRTPVAAGERCPRG